jgi:tetratricopeptide (TPR) repeat protein
MNPIERGQERLQHGDLVAATEAFEAALDAAESVAEAMNGLGRIAALRGEGPAAIAWFARALDINPTDAQAGADLARLLVAAGRHEEARDTLLLAVHHRPECAAAWFQLGKLAGAAGRVDEAIDYFKRATQLAPENPDPDIELGRVYQRLSRWEDAVSHYRSALARGHVSPEAYNDLATCYVPLQRNDEALAIFADLRARHPYSNVPRIGYANVLLQVGRFDEALAEYEAILEREPKNYLASWHRSLILLMRRRYAEGWAGYDSRLLGQVENLPRHFPYPRWRGEPLAGKAVLVHGEQGVGDEIMFASCLPDLIQRAGRVIVECRPKLSTLYARSFPQARVIVTENRPVPEWLAALDGVNWQVAAGSLPGFFRVARDRFPGTPYLRADPARVQHWRETLAGLGPELKVGISWRGGSIRTRSAARSIDIDDCRPLFDAPGCRFVNLQYGETAEDLARVNGEGGTRVHHWQRAIDDYDETAALVSALDIVVTVCTALVHLSGALGQRAWVLVPTVPEWRYGLEGSEMPWYGSVALIRQPAGEAWASTLATVAARLVDLAAASRGAAQR